MKRWLAGLIVVALAALLLPVAIAHAAPPATVYFPPTGHNVGAPFLAYWREHGGLPVYGYPLTEAFSEVSPTDGKTYTVQYFERARFEYHPENAPPNDVLLGLLGLEQYRAMYTSPPPAVPGDPFNSRTLPLVSVSTKMRSSTAFEF